MKKEIKESELLKLSNAEKCRVIIQIIKGQVVYKKEE